jgi:hypothetical protein
MTLTTKIKRILRDARFKSHETTGGAKQPAVKAGTVEHGRARLDQFTKRLRHAIKP